MSLVPTDWSVVVVGRWNRAILTPSGIGRRIFNLQEAAPLEVLLPIDTLAPPQVKHGGITVMAGWDRLTILPEICSYRQLEYAVSLALKAVNSLPETPFSAVGLNVGYTTDEPTPELERVIESGWDSSLSDAGFKIVGRTLARVIPWRQGRINFSIAEEENESFSVRFNYERVSSSVEHHREWLRIPIDDFESTVHKVITECLQIEEDRISHVREPEPASNT